MDNTIFFGNGINRLIPSNISWGELLDRIKDKNIFKDDKLPNTMIYERVVLEKLPKYNTILEDEFDVKEDIAALLKDINPHPVYENLFYINVQNYITTNYDYGFISSLENNPEVVLSIQEFSTEDVYSIRRLKKIITRNGQKKHFWQIHGEIRKPATIMLGLDHYCGSIGKIDTYIKGSYKYVVNGANIIEKSIADKIKDNSFKDSSWIELFFASNIHIIGFTLDFSEADLWWIINKRARMKKSRSSMESIKNEIHFYCSDIEEQKESLLKSMFVNVHVVPYADKSDKYEDHYQKLIKMIKKRL